jgi:hypothetical protein
MPEYQIDVRQVEFYGDFHGRWYSDWDATFTLVQAVGFTDGEFTITGPFGSFIRAGVVHGPNVGVPLGVRSTLTLECSTGFGLTPPEYDSDSVNSDNVVVAGGDPETTEFDFEGGWWRILIDAVFIFGIDLLEEVSPPHYPTYGGAKAFAPPQHTAGTTRFVTLDEGTITVEAELAGAAVSATHTFTGLGSGAGIDREVISNFLITQGLTGNGFIQTETQIDGNPVESSFTRSGAHNEASAGTGNYVYVENDGTGTPNNTFLHAVHGLTREYHVTGVIRAMEAAYPHSPTLLVDKANDDLASPVGTSGGTFEFTISQPNWEASCYFKDTDQGNEENIKTQPIRMWIDPDDLTTLGEPANHWRALIRTWIWDAMSIEQAASIQIAGAHAGLTDAGNSFSIPDGSTDAGAQGSSAGYSGTASFQFGRFLHIGLRHDDAGTETLDSIGIAGKTWSQDYQGNDLDVPTGAGYTEIVLDLCNPDGSEDTDGMSSRYPMDNPASWAWGVNTATEIELNGIDTGVTWYVERVDIERHGYSRVTVLPTCENFVDESSTTDAELRIHHMLGDTDGRVSLETIDFYRVEIAGEDVYTERAIVSVIDSINGVSGDFPTDAWSATDLEPAPMSGCTGDFPPLGCLLNSDRPAFELYGAGAYFNSSWQYGFDLDASTELTLPAQILIDSINAEPGLGDIFGIAGGATTGPMEIRVAVILRGQAAGLVFDEDGKPAPNITVEIDGGTFGAGITGTDGSYQTGLPYVPGGETAEISANVGSGSPSLSEAFFTRKRNRACFRVPIEQLAMYRAVETDSPRGWLHLSDNTRLFVYHESTGALLLQSEEYAIEYWYRLRVDSRRAALYALAKDADTFRLFVSEDGGYTAMEVLSVTATSALVEVDSERGVVTLLYEDGSTTWSSPDNPQYEDETLDGTLLDSAHDWRFGGRIYLVITIEDDTALLMSEDIGANFSLLYS